MTEPVPKPTPPAPEPLENALVLAEVQDAAIQSEDHLAAVLLRLMETDPESNVVFGNVPKGEAEDYAAAVTYAEFSGSPVILRYENMKNMAKRAEGGNLLDRILSVVKAIGTRANEGKASFFTKLKRPGA